MYHDRGSERGCSGTPSAVARWRWIVVRFLVLIAIITTPLTTHAHGGGTPQLTNAEAGPYRLYAWTQPEPWRTGEAHVSIVVTLPPEKVSTDNDALVSQLETAVTDVSVGVAFVPIGSQAQALSVDAARQESLGTIYYEADLQLPDDGSWITTIHVDGPLGAGSATFPVEVLPAHTLNWRLIGMALAVLVLVMGGIGFHARSQSDQNGRQKWQVQRSAPARRRQREHVEKAI